MIKKNFKFEVKSLSDTGEFEGYASVFGVTDLDNEVVDKGAFKRTIDHNKGVVPILWQHTTTEPIGWNASAEEDDYGLKVAGRLLVNTERGKQAYDFLKMGLEVGGKPGLSIGFLVPKDGAYYKSGQRHFKQVAWKEYSVVTFACNEAAFVTSAKSENGIQSRVVAKAAARQKDFAESLDEQRTMSALYQERWDLEGALADVVREAMGNDTMTPDDKKADIAKSLQQYAEAMADWYSRFIDADTDNDEEDDLEDMEDEKGLKSGRKVSQATASCIKAAMQHISDGAACHAKAVGVLQDLSLRANMANDVNKPNPVGGGKSEGLTLNIDAQGLDQATVEQLANAAIAQHLSQKSETEANEGDSQELHSLLALMRSVAESMK